ncbi:MAG: ADOP family duplicated permease [Terriglobia bacterium]
MNWIKQLFSRRSLDGDLNAEIQAHLAEKVEGLVAGGMSREEAAFAARREFGNVLQIEERSREVWQWPFLENFFTDVRYGLRMLRKNPGFTAVAVLTLALGIGANTAIFSVVEGVMLAPLPYFQPDRLVAIWESHPGAPHVWISYPNFQDWQRNARSFQQMAAFAWQGSDVTSPGTPEHLNGMFLSAGLFSTLGVKLALGREFSPQEDQPGGAPVAVISDRLWRDRFAGSPDALGKLITLDGIGRAVVGVLPPTFRLEDAADVYMPIGQGDPLFIDNRAIHPGILAIARLKPGVSRAQAQAEMGAIQNHLNQLYPDADRDLGTDVIPLKQQIVGNAGTTLLLLLGAVGMVLLIACANFASLLLARSAARSREFAVRLALGGSRARVIGQVLTESVLLSLAGGALGLLVARVGINPVLAAVPGNLPRSENIGVNVSVLLFTLGVSIGVGLLFGFVPALKSSKGELELSLKEGSRGATRAHHRAQSSLVTLQIAMTLVLLVGAGLLFRTIRNMWNVDPGFDARHLIAFKVGFSPQLTRTASGTRTACQQLMDRIQHVPGVEAADYTNLVPLSHDDNDSPFWIGTHAAGYSQAAPRLNLFWTGPNYLQTMGIPLLRGRYLTQEDTTHSPPVILVDTDFADAYFPGEDPLGKTITIAYWGTVQIVGVVGHVRHWGLGDVSQMPRSEPVYASFYQLPDPWVPAFSGNLTVIVRTPLPVANVMPAIKRVVYGTGKDQPVYNIHTMQEVASESMASQRFPMVLLGIFAGLALLLASVGIYGVISYSVAQRAREIGIRLALGADQQDVFRMVIGQGLRLALAGLVIGVAGALGLTRLLTSLSHLLYGVTASDPVTFIAVSLLLIAVAILACYVPARRATKVDSMVTLRCE